MQHLRRPLGCLPPRALPQALVLSFAAATACVDGSLAPTLERRAALLTLDGPGELALPSSVCAPAGTGDGSRLIMSEFLAANPGGPSACDAALLQTAIDTLGLAGELTLDVSCNVGATLYLPHRFTLRGTGLGGAGIIAATHTGRGIELCPGASHVNVEDLALYGPDGNPPDTSVGIMARGNSFLRLSHVRVSNFHTGVLALATSLSGLVADSHVADNSHDNIRILGASNAWRIRGGVISQAGIDPESNCDSEAWPGCYGVRVHGVNDTLLDGVRMERNWTGALWTDALTTQITHCRVEHHEGPGPGGFVVASGAEDTYLAGNNIDLSAVANARSVVIEPGARRTVLLGNAQADASVEDAGELTVRLEAGALAPFRTPPLFSSYVQATNSFRTLLFANATSDAGVHPSSSVEVYGSWALELEGRPAFAEQHSRFRLRYRGAGSALANPVASPSVFEVDRFGGVTAGAFGFTASAAQLKTDLVPITDALARLSQLTGYQFRWVDGHPEPQLGLLAEEVQAAFPQAVRRWEERMNTTGDDAQLAVSYDMLVAPLVEAVKALAAENGELRDASTRLERRILALEVARDGRAQ